MKGKMVPLTVGPSAPKAKVFLSFSPLAAITGSRRSCSCWIQWIINFRSPSRSPALYLTQVCGHGFDICGLVSVPPPHTLPDTRQIAL